MKHEPRLASETNLFKCGTRNVPIILHDKVTRFKPKKRGGTEIQYLSVTGAIWTKITELCQFLGAFAGY
jgi:hypothetical protein